jgi:hypothetical protein
MMRTRLFKSDPVFGCSTPTIVRAADLSITALLNLVRITLLLLPLYLSLPQSVRAESATANSEVITYETIDDESVSPPQDNLAAPARFGPFVVISPKTVQMDGITDAATPDQFRRLLALYPGISRIEMIDCPGTENDDANLAVARMIRRAGIATHVPASGSIRSGAIELFLAGLRRSYDRGAEFGVHSWQDEDGREARDVPANDPVNIAYINYYQEIGLPRQTAREFYAFTNQTAFDNIHYMTESELARFQIIN